MPEESRKAVWDMSAITTATPGPKAACSSSPTPWALVTSISPGKVTISGRTSGFAVALRALLSNSDLRPGSGASDSAGHPLATANRRVEIQADRPDQAIIWQPVVSVQPRQLPPRLVLQRNIC